MTLVIALIVTWVLAPLWMAVRYRLLYGRWPADDQPHVVTIPWMLGAPLRPDR